MWQHRFVVWSGFLGATASCFAKLALSGGDDGILHNWFQDTCRDRVPEDLDVWIVQKVNSILGDIMVKHGIVLMDKWKFIVDNISEMAVKLGIFDVDWCTALELIPRIVCLILVILINVWMIASFVKGLEASGSVAGTALSSASNFACSAFFGHVVWKESFSETWWVGFASVIVGVMLLTTVQPTDNTSSSSSKQYGKKGVYVMTKKSSTTLIDRSFANECPLCQGQLFDESTGESPMAIADLSPNCFHVVHGKCLKQQSSGSPTAASPRRASGVQAGCPVCDKSISMWISSKQAAHFSGFWVAGVEACLQKLGPNRDKNSRGLQTVSAQLVRDMLKQDETLTDEQKGYIYDDPTGLGKGLTSALEWGGYVDFNGQNKGQLGWSHYLRSRGIWKYDAKKDDLWLWEWGNVHPRQRCEGCQFMNRSLPVECSGCKGSCECAYYCTENCQKRDWLRHKMMCESWQSYGPSSQR
jgi:multidrug transporter EmrE-like cation transporter